MVLGKAVLNNQGVQVGTVADVGLHDLRRVKYLLIQQGAGAAKPSELQFMRLGVDRINKITPGGVVLTEDEA
ncbi:MAG TPA: hypothetical protein VNZ52_04170 [Candidatus Thermoplasmatota archaeon]|nr:hypothetical protein [Candidatus Thermoplasmatota archaeon]